MMKHTYLLTTLSIFATVSIAGAQQTIVDPTLSQGTRALSVQGSIDDDGEDMGGAFDISAGQFIMNYIEMGARLGVGFRGSDQKNIAIAGYGEYNVDMQSLWFPYVGGSLGLGYMEFFDEDESFVELQAYGGLRYFFVDHASIGSELALKFASEDIYNRGEDAFDWQFRLRTTWYY